MTLHLLLALPSFLHLAAVGLATVGPLWCVWLRWYAARSREQAVDQLARRLAVHSTAALVVGMALGGVLLGAVWLLPQGGFFRGARLVPPSRFWFGAVEAAFSFFCLAGYWLWWPGGHRGLFHRLGHAMLALLGTTNLAYHFPTLFAVANLYAAQPELAAEGFRQAMLHPEVPARTIHFLLAAVLLSGLWMCSLARRVQGEPGLSRMATVAARGVLVAGVLQIVSGAALLGALAPTARDALLSASLPATALLGLSVMATVLLLHRLAALSLGDTSVDLPRHALWLVAAIMLLMCAARQVERVHAVGFANAVPRGEPARLPPGTLSTLAQDTPHTPDLLPDTPCAPALRSPACLPSAPPQVSLTLATARSRAAFPPYAHNLPPAPRGFAYEPTHTPPVARELAHCSHCRPGWPRGADRRQG